MKQAKLFGRFFGLLTLTALCASCSDDSGSDKGSTTPGTGTGLISEQTQKEIKDHFTTVLAGSEDEFSSPITIESEKLEANSNLVWAAWKGANDGFDEDKLIELQPLSEKHTGRWPLPASLEPNATMPYYWGSKGNKPTAGYPLFLYLHGSGDKTSEWATGLSLGLTFDDAPSAYFIPQIPNTGNYYRWWQKAKQYAWERLLRQAFVSGDINPDRVYFFGISEGGYGSQRLASFYADYLAGAGPMAGGEPLKNAPAENCANTAFSLRTGANDDGFYRNTLTGYTQEAFEELENAHPGYYTHFIELIPGMGHGIDYTPTTPWLKQYTRNPYPHYVYWENFEMDNQYRTGFYNIHVDERSNTDFSTRSCYEMTISGNNITLKVDEVRYTTTETDPAWGIEMRFEKSKTPATRGKLTIYLCNELVDLSKSVKLTVNGKQVFSGVPEIRLEHMVNSCAQFFDPCRIYPAAIEVDLSKL